MRIVTLVDLRIVIVTYNWPPRNSIGTHRPLAWARHWTAAGAQVTVLTAQKQPFDRPLDLTFSPIDGLRVVEVSMAGSASLTGFLLKSQLMRVWARKAKKRFLGRAPVAEDPRSSWRSKSKSMAKQLALNADVVVSTFGPSSAHLIGYDMKMANPDLFWVADYRDLWPHYPAASLTHQTDRRATRVHRDTVGIKADLVTAVSAHMVEQLRIFFNQQTVELPNGFDLDEEEILQTLSTKPTKRNGPMRIVYTGPIYEGTQDPRPLLQALADLHKNGGFAKGQATVDFYGSRVDLARRLAKNPIYSPFIRLMGHVSRDDALEAQRAAGLLLLLESSEPEARGVLTGKVFEYMVTGRPILCVGSRPEYEIGQLLRATGTGQVFGPDEKHLLESVLLNTLGGEGLFQAHSANIGEILKYSRKKQSEWFLGVLIKKLESRSKRK